MKSDSEFENHVRAFADLPDLTSKEKASMLGMGLTGEAGEVTDLLKKHLYHGDTLYRAKLIKEMGDVAWYWVAIAQHYELGIQEILGANIAKLEARHGGKSPNFTAARVNKERE